MNDTNDLFIYLEGKDRVAYHAGREIARMSPMGHERFITALFQWMRRNGALPIWLVDANGQKTPADDLQKEINARLEN